jgi:hypothetical protein
VGRGSFRRRHARAAPAATFPAHRIFIDVRLGAFKGRELALNLPQPREIGLALLLRERALGGPKLRM